MNLINYKPVARKAVLSERPCSARFIAPQRIIRGSFHIKESGSAMFPNGIYAPVLQDMGTSMINEKKTEEDHEILNVPVQNITFNVAPVRNKTRKRKILVAKYLKSQEPQEKHLQCTHRSTLRFLHMEKPAETIRKSTGSRISFSTSRPSTGKPNCPVTRRALSDYYFDSSQGPRLFDISEVLSIAHGQINLKFLKLSR